MRTLSLLLLAIASLLPAAATAQVPAISTARPRIMLVGPELQRFRNDLAARRPAMVRFKEQVVDVQVVGGNIYGYEPWYSAFISVVTQQASYCTHAIQMTDTFLDAEAQRINAGQTPEVRADSYLHIGEHIGSLALVFDWCHGQLNAQQKLRWGNYADRFITNVWNQATNRWGAASAANNWSWEGTVRPAGSEWSINNPINNYYYSFLRATVLWGLASKHEPDRPLADAWLTKFRVEKIQNQLVPAFVAQISGGGSREGTGYGTAMKGLFNLYYLWERTTNQRISDLTTHSEMNMPYMLNATAPKRDYLAPIGDHARDSTASFYDYHREGLLALATLFPSTPLARNARDFLAAGTGPGNPQATRMGDRFNWVFDMLYDGIETTRPALLNSDHYAIGTGHFFSRSSWASNAVWLTFLTGAYSESHAHRDGLSIMLYKNGFLINDANQQSHSGLANLQNAHGMVTQIINGTEQRMFETPTSTAVLRALSSNMAYTYASADQGTLYTHSSVGGDPGIRSNREIIFLKPSVVIVRDVVSYVGAGGTSTKRFQLPFPGQPTLSGRLVTYNNGSSYVEVAAVAPSTSALSTIAMSSVDSDFEGGYRFDNTVTGSGVTQFMHVLSVDGAATFAGRGATDADVGVNLADGRTVTVNFTPNAPGGTIQIRNANMELVTNETLPTRVAYPSLYGFAPNDPTSRRPALDMSSDTRSDMLFRNIQNGQLWRVLMNAPGVPGSSAPSYVEGDLNWKLVNEGDFDGDGHADLLYHHADGRVAIIGLVNGVGVRSNLVPGAVDAAWKVVGTPDINGDGRADILWRNSTTGVVWAMLMNNLTILAQGQVYQEPSQNWKIVAVGDFNGRGKRNQVLWHNLVDGRVFLQTLQYTGGAFSATGIVFYTEPNVAWRIQGVADLDGDGKADIVWRNGTTGQVYVMLMDGSTVVRGAFVYTEPSAAWKIAALGDYDGDGRADLMWRNDNDGRVYLLRMAGAAVAGGSFVWSEPNTAWRLVGHQYFGEQ